MSKKTYKELEKENKDLKSELEALRSELEETKSNLIYLERQNQSYDWDDPRRGKYE